MLEALGIIILLPFAFGAILFLGGLFFGGLGEIFNPPKDPWAR